MASTFNIEKNLIDYVYEGSLSEKIEGINNYGSKVSELFATLKVNIDKKKEIHYIQLLSEMTYRYQYLLGAVQSYDITGLRDIADNNQQQQQRNASEKNTITDDMIKYLIEINIIKTIDTTQLALIEKYFDDKSHKNQIKVLSTDFTIYRAIQGHIISDAIKHLRQEVQYIQDALQGKTGVAYQKTSEIKNALDAYKGKIPSTLYRGKHSGKENTSLKPSFSNAKFFGSLTIIKETLPSFPYKKIKKILFSYNQQRRSMYDINEYTNIDSLEFVRNTSGQKQQTGSIENI